MDKCDASGVRIVIRMQMLNARTVAARLAVSRPLIYVLIREHGFPKPLKLGGRRVWLESEVDAWLLRRSEAR
jgi:predicted DNA-binding transcriptional regulator AlpA